MLVADLNTTGESNRRKRQRVVSRDRRKGTVVIHQLRIYELFEHNKVAFHDRFRDHAARIMRTYGFDIVAMWETQTGGRTEFVYLLAWPDEHTMRSAWAKFMADDEWKEIKRVTSGQHGDLVGAIEDRVLVPTNYTPSWPHDTALRQRTS